MMVMSIPFFSCSAPPVSDSEGFSSPSSVMSDMFAKFTDSVILGSSVSLPTFPISGSTITSDDPFPALSIGGRSGSSGDAGFVGLGTGLGLFLGTCFQFLGT